MVSLQAENAYTNLLVGFLPITALLDDSHDQVLRGHEW